MLHHRNRYARLYGTRLANITRSDSPHRENRRMQENSNIHEEISMLNVVEIVFNVFVNQVVAVTTELPKSSDSWLYVETLRMAFSVGLDNEGHLRTRANKGHIAQKH